MPLFDDLKQCFRRSKKSPYRPSTNQGPDAIVAEPVNNSEPRSRAIPLAPLNPDTSPDPYTGIATSSLIPTPPSTNASAALTAPVAPSTANHHADATGRGAVAQTPPNHSPTPADTQGTKHIAEETMWPGFKLLVGLIDASMDAIGPLKSAVGRFKRCIKIYDRTAQNREDYRALRNELNALFTDVYISLSGSSSPMITTVVKNFFKGIEAEADFVLAKEQRSGTNRVAEAMADQDEVLECYRRIQSLVQRVALNVNLSTWKIVDTLATENRLKDLSPAHSARYSSDSSTKLRRQECTPNTRVIVMEDLRGWSERVGNQKIYWLNGMAGTGKTTIAYSLSKHLEAMNTLAASFFCSRQLPECRNVSLIIPTIAYQLATVSHPFKCALSRVIEQNPDAHARDLSEQFKKLLVDPLEDVAQTIPSNLVVVIDALDECEDKDGVAQMLDALLLFAPDLPLKFFTTSRSEPRIQSRMMSPEGDHMRLKLHLHELEHSIVKEDIQTYLETALDHMNISAGNLESLCKRSGALFIHAATAVRYISGHISKPVVC